MAPLKPPIGRGLVAEYAAFLRAEPRARAYLSAALIDDAGVAVSAWASALMMTNLAETQRVRASLMLPALACFLVGTIISGPLADWMAAAPKETLARWRWKVVLCGRAVETALLAILVVQLSLAPPTIARVMPYVMVSALMKTALRSTRIAFSMDLLVGETPSRGDDGTQLRDERGDPLTYKTHLVTFWSVDRLFLATSTLGGLVIGGQLMAMAGGRMWIPFALDVLTNVGFIVVVWSRCAPPAGTWIGEERGALPFSRPNSFVRFFQSLAEGVRFLAAPERRELLALLAGSWIVEVVSEAYDGKMIVRHILHGSDDAIRRGVIVWTAVSLTVAALLPAVLRKTASIGKIFLVTMSLDALVITLAGVIAAAGDVSAIVPFVAALCVDHTLTLMSTTLTDVVQNSESSSAMRGRIAGTFAIAVILGDMISEASATWAEDRWGIPGLMVRVGFVQLVLVGVIARLGRRKLWAFGLRTDRPSVSGPSLAAST